MPNRIKLALVASLTMISSLLAAAPVGAAATPQKVVIIVGPTGAQTDDYRSKGDSIAATAEAAGATAVKVYSPNATWANVKAAVNGANIIVYLGHGNGYPNPYGPTELTDRTNGWGLNRTTSGGDADDWSATMVYCGEKALLGTLTSASTAQWSYCGGSTNTDGITPAANWVMLYSNACYAPGAGEGFDVKATEDVALQRVRNYSYPALLLGASAYYATDKGADRLVDLILRNPSLTYTDITRGGNGYDELAQRHFTHPDLPSAEIWLQKTGTDTSADYWYAFAGNPLATPAGGLGTPSPTGPTFPGATTYNPVVGVTFKAGSYSGYKFDSNGVPTGVKGYTLGTDSSASAGMRATIPNQAGSWLYVTNGIWAGYWMQESSSVYLTSP